MSMDKPQDLWDTEISDGLLEIKGLSDIPFGFGDRLGDMSRKLPCDLVNTTCQLCKMKVLGRSIKNHFAL